MIKNIIAILLFGVVFLFAGPVSIYGQLNTNGNKIVGSKWGSDNIVQLRGISMGWSNTGWESARFFNEVSVNALIDDWKAEIIRVPIGYSEGGGYKTDPSNLTRVKTVIDAVIAKDVYVIIDWHSHDAHNETNAAKAFFKEMAETYGAEDHVIFEVYNEPKQVSWSNQIKPYAVEIITEIRKNSDNLILVGTPMWSLKVDDASKDPINEPNIAYVFHFYANTHTTTNEGVAVTTAINSGVPVFVSEYGTVTADGNGTHSGPKTDTWMTFLNDKKISFCAWQVSNKNEASAFFTSQSPVNANYPFTQLSASGQYVYDKLRGWANVNDEPWRGGPVSPSSSSNLASSSSSSGSTPIVFKSPDANGIQLMKNGVSLQVTNNATVEVFGLNGNSVRKLNFASGTWPVQFSDLPKGLYIVRVSFGNEKRILRVPVN